MCFSPLFYSWEEDVWRIDFTGAEPSVKAVDENGWTYAIDFNYLEFPFSVGGGIVRMNQVRRKPSVLESSGWKWLDVCHQLQLPGDPFL